MSDDFRFQLSVKFGGYEKDRHLLNLRAATAEEFSGVLKWAVENAEQIQLAAAPFEPARQATPPAPASAPRQAPNVPQGGAGREIGPLYIEGVEIKKGPRDGPPWKNPMYVLKFPDGTSASTFDPLNGKAAMGFWTNGTSCFVAIEPSAKNPKYLNVTGIRMATQ